MNPKYLLDTAENRAFLTQMRNDLLAFGHRFPSPGGTAYWLGDDGTPWKDRRRDSYVTSRMAHVYSIGSSLGHAGSEDLLAAAIRGLRGEMHDTVHGGWYAGLDSENKPLPGKQCYAHAFVILAASSAKLAGHPEADALYAEAASVYDRYFWNEDEGLSRDTWNTEFTVLDSYRGLNANMHTVEAFLGAADVFDDEKYRVRAGRIIDSVLVWAKNNDWRIPEHYSDKWIPNLDCNRDRPDDPFKPYGATPGHGLEWGRLITQWALSTYKDDKESAKKPIDCAEQLYCRAIDDAWNTDGGRGICYTTDWDGKPVVHDRMHWVLAEAINTASILARLTGKERYAKDYAAFMQYLDEVVLDHVNGSWYHQMDKDGHVMTTVWPGKNDIYHALQATLIPYYEPSLSIALAVKEGKTI